MIDIFENLVQFSHNTSSSSRVVVVLTTRRASLSPIFLYNVRRLVWKSSLYCWMILDSLVELLSKSMVMFWLEFLVREYAVGQVSISYDRY